MEIQIGEVTHFYARIFVAVLKLSSEIHSGDLIHIQGHSTDFCQRVKSMEINHHPVLTVVAGQDVALKVLQTVRRGDRLFKVVRTGSEELEPEDLALLDMDW